MAGMNHCELQQLLEGLGSASGAAEAHGCLCGALCVRDGQGAAEWVSDLVDGIAEPVAGGLEIEALQQLHQETGAALRTRDPGFTPLLPEDTAPLGARVEALAAWCSGFLYGLGLGGSGSLLADAGAIGEILRDFAEIARATLPLDATAEEGEQAYVELVEFVRAGAQLAFEELAGHAAGAPAAGPGLH
jgi:uncharacterized protein YgfB (UPF0149 family)